MNNTINQKVLPLWVVADNSGSMGEDSKLYILRNLINYVRERLYVPYNNLSFNTMYAVTWNKEVKDLKIDPNHQLPKFELQGKTDIGKLIKYFDEIPQENEEKSKILIFSDWKLDNKNISQFNEWVKDQKNKYSIRVVIIETGLSINSINNMPSKNYFHPQDIIKSLSPWE